MANTTTYECDGCGRSIPDPGKISNLELRSYGLNDGGKFLDHHYSHQNLDLCSSCASNVKRVINRVLTLGKV